MNSYRFRRFGAILLAACMVLAFGGGAWAQEVKTAPVGAITVNLAQGYTMVGVCLLSPPVLTASSSSNTSSSVSLEGVVDIGSWLVADGLYYAEVTAGPLEGERFDLNTAATISAKSSAFVINTASRNNTYTLTDGALDGCRLVIRPHITLEKVAGMVTPSLVGNNSVGSADQILIYDSNPQVNALQTYFLRSDNVTWRKSGESGSVGKSVIIPPGIGFFIKKNAAGAKLTYLGDVRVNDFAMPMNVGMQLFASPFPGPVTPVGLGGAGTNGWTGNNSVNSADQIVVFNTQSAGYDTYFLRSDGVTWRKSGFADDVKGIEIVPVSAAFWLKRSSSDTNYILNQPFNL